MIKGCTEARCATFLVEQQQDNIWKSQKLSRLSDLHIAQKASSAEKCEDRDCR
jgi:hypothetical protein